MMFNSLAGSEVVVLRLLGLGYNNSAISKKLFISESEVAETIMSIMRKFAVNSREEVCKLGMEVFGNL